MYTVLLFYKYILIENPEKIASVHLEFCRNNDIKGRIFLAREGINGTVCATESNIEKYKKHITSFPEFRDIIFKDDKSEMQAFKKIFVRVRDEIVNSDLDINPSEGGRKLSPSELLDLYRSGKEFVLLDARNNYESKIGKFHNAVTPDIENFRDWKEAVKSLNHLKDKTIVTYCTGGIRCEKASAYMRKEGFEDVYQLDGGIINFTKQYPDTYWEGGIFVFDERRVVNPNKREDLKHIAKCYFCGTPTSYYINCHNLDCDKIIVSCHDCKIKNDYCCSDECRESPNKRKVFHG